MFTAVTKIAYKQTPISIFRAIVTLYNNRTVFAAAAVTVFDPWSKSCSYIMDSLEKPSDLLPLWMKGLPEKIRKRAKIELHETPQKRKNL
ncbi:hypothetical protein CEXT_300161 [Caerostris extrusa]|uniref:Uncharacterized protein n=1 Tax=Caerostris extrusa TaxID=172846 RepID=A0AAV4TXJ3_CAEEX|nr:hypothetical protein CEXT_300161 [Caerostris extrusa]